MTLPLRPHGIEAGRIHPVSQVMDELAVIFADMGFAIAEGPDIESDDYNFTKLNFPPDHPARDMHDTFFFNPGPDGTRKVLRTHTSPVQVRTMLTQKPPIRVIMPGPHLPLRLRPDAYADVSSGRGACHRPLRASWSSEMDLGRILQGVLRGAGRQDALPAELFSVHRTLDGSRYSMLPQRRRDAPWRGRGLARNSRLRHGASECLEKLRARSR